MALKEEGVEVSELKEKANLGYMADVARRTAEEEAKKKKEDSHSSEQLQEDSSSIIKFLKSFDQAVGLEGEEPFKSDLSGISSRQSSALKVRSQIQDFASTLSKQMKNSPERMQEEEDQEKALD